MSASRRVDKNRAVQTPEREDHRVRVAREKRERMRSHLLQATMVVCSGRASSGPAVVDDVIREAQVSRGTFYKYFNTLDEAIAELGALLADEMTLRIYPVYNVLDSPVERAATGYQLFLCRAVIDANWGGFVSHVGKLTTESVLVKHIISDVRLGIESGDFKVGSLDAAVDCILGLQTEAIRRIIGGGHKGDYVRIMAGIMLRGLGISPDKAEQAVAQAYKNLCRNAPKCIAWWKPIA